MREVAGDLWTWDDPPGSVVARVITTNGFVTKDGKAVLGRGVAAQAVERFGDALKVKLGEYLSRWGNHVHAFPPNRAQGRTYWLITFPVKPPMRGTVPGFKAPAEIGIIQRSASQLVAFTLGMLGDGGTVVLPRPGCGCGGLGWNEVEPILRPILDQPVYFHEEKVEASIGDRFVVIERGY